MHYSQVKLPKERGELIACYLYLSTHLRNLWVEYVSFTENIDVPVSADIYKIIFSEMDFYEGLRARVADRLPQELIRVLRNVDDYSSW